MLFAFFAVQLAYSQARFVSEAELYGTTATTESELYFVLDGEDTFPTTGNYAGGRLVVCGWYGPGIDPGLDYLVDLSSENYTYEWSAQGYGGRAYVTGIGRFGEVSLYKEGIGSASARITCEIYAASGEHLGTATGYIYLD